MIWVQKTQHTQNNPNSHYGNMKNMTFYFKSKDHMNKKYIKVRFNILNLIDVDFN